MRLRRILMSTVAVITLLAAATAASAQPQNRQPPKPFVTGLASGSGSTIGPDGALYVTEGATGRILRINPRNGRVSTFASGLPPIIPAVGIGGAMDVAFIGQTAYVLVILVGSDTGGTDTVGIYRIDSPTTSTVIADLGAFAIANPPATDFFVPSGVAYAIQRYGRDLLVTDGHHNRVLRVTLHGEITQIMTFGNIVPTGMDLLGPIVVKGAGGRLVVDVEVGPGQQLYALSQGVFTPGNPEGSPANPNTGALMVLKKDGSFGVVADHLNQPTSLEFIGDTAFVVTLGGEIWKFDNVSR